MKRAMGYILAATGLVAVAAGLVSILLLGPDAGTVMFVIVAIGVVGIIVGLVWARAKHVEAEPLPQSPESQSQRWMKYGSNVVLTVILAIVVAGLITYIAQAKDHRFDTTAQGVNSLKPQTRNVLHDLNSDIKIISLYTKAENSASTANEPHPIDRAGFVSDLLDEYKSASGHVSTEVIDPVAEKGKIDQLITDLEHRYGTEIKSYQDFLHQYEEAYKQLLKLTDGESEKVAALPVDSLGNDRTSLVLRGAISAIQSGFPRTLRDSKDRVDRGLKEPHPDYKAITDSLRGTLDDISKNEEEIAKLEQFKDNKEIPQPIRDYFKESVPRHQAIKKTADEQLAKIGKLGELKIDEIKRALNVPDPILVLGPNDWRVLSESQVWPENTNARMYSEGKVYPTFAGEQQVTSAIIGLTTAKKPKIVFIRPGGPPVTSPGFPPFIPSGPLAEWAGRLRAYNFEVLDKDLSGQWAMQAQMQQMPSAPDPEWSTIEDAVWVVLDAGQAPSGPEALAPRLAEHLGHGGSAIVLADVQGDTLANVMKDWGVEIRSDAIAVHEPLPPPRGNSGRVDQIQDTLRRPLAWDIKNYGEGELAKPLTNLESFMAPLIVINSHEVKGYTLWKLLPLPTKPQAPMSWGETNLTGMENGEEPSYDEKTDIKPPVWGGAAVEKQGGGRLVVLGSERSVFNIYFEYPDQEILRNEDRLVPRFPGNGELAMNSAFWCAKMDSMIALSPAALQVSRIDPNMSKAMLAFLRWGVVLVLLPLAVLASGIVVYFSRRD